MGRQSEEALKVVSVEELMGYLSKEHSVYMQHGAQTYYITDANDIYWRAQDTNRLNEKGHFVDCSELIPILREFVELPFLEGQSIKDVFDSSTFYPSIKIEGQGTPVPII
ncbi:putative uncharacterized protein [Eggerthella sp. CAG:368]|jgi:hypothetical protein|uniref:hypothetical protein n=1 Tax=Ellagibacter isourolithinifaciens TaxID=2137581 RepID=UPI000338E571|nr:putative uncharacterized protein [Eggerthella sp. CAG:368]